MLVKRGWGEFDVVQVATRAPNLPLVGLGQLTPDIAMLPARPALHPTADEKAVRLPIRGFPDLGQGRALGPSDQFQDLRSLAVGTRGSAKFAADLGDLSVKLVTPGVAVVLWNGAVQKADQVSDIAFGERGPWDLKVFRTAIHPGAVPPKCGGERKDAEESAGRAKCRPISGAFGAGTMASAATALNKQGCARLWRSGRLEVANTGEESEKIRDLPAVKLRSWDVADFRCVPHLGGVVPHLAGKLYDAARQMPFTAKFRPDPASLPVQRVADAAGLALKNLPASSRKHGWYCKSLTAQEDCLHLCGTGVIHVVTAEGDFTMATPNTEEQATQIGR